MRRGIGIAAAAFGASAVVLGAFGAHALQSRLDEAALRIWHTAVEYQFWHALALMTLAGAAPSGRLHLRHTIVIVFCAGTTLFCGSLYALAFGAPRWVGAITPCGGLALILGWALYGLLWCTAAREPS